MKKVLYISMIAGIALLGESLSASSFSKEASIKPQILQKTKHPQKCTACGMKLPIFWKTSHAVKLQNGEYIQYCSIRDLVKDEKDKKLNIVEYLAVDATSEKLMDATKMFYVVGSKIKGTMSKVSKIAFEHKSDAIEFQKHYGGELKNFSETKAFSLEILEEDIEMIKKKKAMMKKRAMMHSNHNS